MFRHQWLYVLACIGAVTVGISEAQGDGFTDPANWATYDYPDDNATDGYTGVAYDDVHDCVYFAPWIGSKTITRYCKPGAFDDPSSWETCDVGTNFGAEGGYNGATFDGRYVYFAPFSLASGVQYGDVLRFDTLASFCDPTETNSWQRFDALANADSISNAVYPGGFAGALFADGYVYFAPNRLADGTTNQSSDTGEVLRYNTNCNFSDPACWQAFDYSKSPTCVNDPECHALGYSNPCFDGRFIYFSPGARAPSLFHGEVLRYDSLGDFSNEANWATFDFGEHCTPGENCTDPDGYSDCAVDGAGVVYFAQIRSDTSSNQSGEILRYDSKQTFTDTASWSTYDTVDNAPLSKGGYDGVFFDGFRYMYFVPNASSKSWPTAHGEVLRLDTQASFAQPDAWAIYDYGHDPNGCAMQPGCSDPDGYDDAVFDGRYIYFSPSFNGTTMHGEVLRYDTLTVDGVPIPAVGVWGLFLMCLLLMTGGTLIARRSRTATA